MKKLMQTRLDNFPKRGNAYITCISCFLGLESAEDAWQVQEHFIDVKWSQTLMEWLLNDHNKCLVAQKNEPEKGYYIVTGTAGWNMDHNHWCIYKDGELFHDPHPEQKGLLDHLYYERVISLEKYLAEEAKKEVQPIMKKV